ncbi:MAG: hypothetical protein HFG41_10075 [Coprococcus sp.]|nr:hypothetical protein [Coprococcus sp.]
MSGHVISSLPSAMDTVTSEGIGTYRSPTIGTAAAPSVWYNVNYERIQLCCMRDLEWRK